MIRWCDKHECGLDDGGECESCRQECEGCGGSGEFNEGTFGGADKWIECPDCDGTGVVE